MYAPSIEEDAGLRTFSEKPVNVDERLTVQLNRKIEDLEATRRSFNALIGNLRGMVYRCRNEPGWTMEYVSDACLDITGYPPQALIDNKEVSYGQLIHEEDRDRVNEQVQAALRENRPFEVEYRLKHRDGSIVWVWEQGVCTSSGSVPERLEGYVSDITERRKVSMERNRFFELTLEMLCVAGIDGYFKHLNPSWSRVLGWSNDELMARPWIELVHPDDRDPTEKARVSLIEGNEVLSFRNRCLHKDGSYRWLSWDSMLLPAEGLMYGAVRDITEEIRNEKKMSQLNRALRVLSAGNRALVRVGDEVSLLKEMCKVLVEEGGYPIAWVGFSVDDDIHSVKPVASAGVNKDFFDELDTNWDDTMCGEGPTSMAIRTGEPQLVKNIQKDPTMARWHDFAMSHGLTALISLPLFDRTGESIGVMNIYGVHGGVFIPEEIKLLEELANDLSYGIGTHRLQADKMHTETMLEESLLQAIQAIARTVEKRDPYTAGHQNRVAQLAVAIATEMNMSESEIDGIRLGATIHDIGKIYIPAEILNRPGRLTDHEFGLIKTHPEVGFEIVEGVPFPWPIAEMVRQHHERLDGSGYPQGLKGAEILLEARIMAVADVVEAITSHRPYRPALGLEAGVEEIQKKRGEWFDPQAVDACVRLVTEGRFRFH